MMLVELKSLEDAVDLLNSEAPRTKVWGIDNRTNEKIEIAFGQLHGYDIPSYAVDTGVVVLGQNTAPGGDLISDPLSATSGLPLAAYQYDASVKVNGQVLNIRQVANEGEYMLAAVAVLSYTEGALSTDLEKKLDFRVITRSQKLLSSTQSK